MSASPSGSAGSASGVSVAGLTKAFGAHPVLHGVDLEVPAGSITAILGPSGSGKTTLLRLLAGFERPDGGTIAIGGRQVDGLGRHVATRDRHIGYVPQEGSLFPHLDVRANVGFGLPRSDRKARVAELLDLTGLSELARRYPHQLSGGQQQRVALARALAPEPSLVLLDEPFSSLDAFLRASVRLDVVTILRKAGITAVVVTHDQDEALSMADQVAVFRDGVVAQCGPPEEVYARPVDAALARFVGGANLVPGTLRDGRVETAFGSLSVLEDPSAPGCLAGPVVALLRPEQLHVVPEGDGAAVSGVVTQSDFHGHDAVITVDTAGGAGADVVTVRHPGARPLPPGTRVGLRATGPVPVWPAPAGSPG